LTTNGIAADLDSTAALAPRFLKLLATLALWSALPNGRRAMFYDFWEGMLVGAAKAKDRRRADMAKVLARLASGAIKPVIAATFPLREAAAALARSEARGLFGKVVIVP